MNNTTFNTTSSTFSLCLFLRNHANSSPDVRAVLIARIVVNVLTCPLIIFFNILVMVAVKTKPQLRTKSNIALACLSTTDLAVGLVLQPLYIAIASSLLSGYLTFCAIIELSNTLTIICLLASFHHLVLMSAERYFAIKHPFLHENLVTKVRIIIASALVWAAAIILSSEDLLPKSILVVSETLLTILPIYCNVSVYKEVRRNKKQIAANQVSLEAKEKLLKNRKAFYTTVIVLVVIFLCYIPTNACVVVLGVFFKERISPNIIIPTMYAVSLLPVLNSLFNPLIYAVRIRNFRVAFIQLFSRKTTVQAEELERKIFRSRQSGVNGNLVVGQGNQTLNVKHEPSRQAEPRGGCKETPL